MQSVGQRRCGWCWWRRGGEDQSVAARWRQQPSYSGASGRCVPATVATTAPPHAAPPPRHCHWSGHPHYLPRPGCAIVHEEAATE